jgi:hypothetical protein
METLQKYRTAIIVISAEDAHRVLSVFFPNSVPAVQSLDDNDRRFAQALIVEAAEASAEIGMLKSLWLKASNPAVKPMALFKTVAKAVLRYMGRPKSVQGAVDSPQYGMVINTIAWKWGRVWQIRVQTGDSSMLL